MSRPTESIADITSTFTDLQKLLRAPEFDPLAAAIFQPKLEELKRRISHLGQLEFTDLRASQDPYVRVSELPGSIQTAIYQLAPFPFLTLPAELRNKIYPFVYDTANARIPDNGRFEFRNGKLIRKNTSALLFANKQIFLESQEFIYKGSAIYFEAGFGVPHIAPFRINIPDLHTYPSLGIWTQEIVVRTGTDHRRAQVNQQVMDAIEHFKSLKKITVKITAQYCTQHELSSLTPFVTNEALGKDTKVELNFLWDHNLRPLRTSGVFNHVSDEEGVQEEMSSWEDAWADILEPLGFESCDDAPIIWKEKARTVTDATAQ